MGFLLEVANLLFFLRCVLLVCLSASLLSLKEARASFKAASSLSPSSAVGSARVVVLLEAVEFAHLRPRFLWSDSKMRAQATKARQTHC